MVCLGNICINTLHKGAKDDDDDNNNNNNNNNILSSWHSVVCMGSVGHAGRTGGNYNKIVVV
jgi:hypothetical protein